MTQQTSLERIAQKAKDQPEYRFRDLCRELSQRHLKSCWKKLNKQSAAGVDGVTYGEYEKDLESNLANLIDRLKKNAYKAKLVRRQYIPKVNGKMRPLGIPVLEDKLLQTAVSELLMAIYEQDFRDCSYGYRPKRGAKEAVDSLQHQLNNGQFNWVVEADIRGFFDNINHNKLVEMLEKRIDDQRFIRLIRKWLKAGVLDTDGKVLNSVSGTPQGGVISPILANIYMHHVLVEWFEEMVRPCLKGQAILCVYADDFVCSFEDETDSKRFFQTLPKRLAKFGLEVAPEKTRKLRFSRIKDGDDDHFDFLGFEFRWAEGMRGGQRYVKRVTSSKKLLSSIDNCTMWIKANRHLPIRLLIKRLNSKLRGYYNYFHVYGNSIRCWRFDHIVRNLLYKWLNRRSQRRSYNWNGFIELMKFLPLTTPTRNGLT